MSSRKRRSSRGHPRTNRRAADVNSSARGTTSSNPSTSANGTRGRQGRSGPPPAGETRGGYRVRRSVSSNSGGGQTASDDSNDEDYDIPGFYYDKAKKRYFKILPATNTNSGVVTAATIRDKTKEEKRLAALGNLNVSESKPNQPTTLSLITNRTLHGPSSNWPQSFIKTRLSQLQQTSNVKIFPEPGHNYEMLEHMWTILPAKNPDKILGLWSLQGALLQRIQFLQLGGATSLTVKPGAFFMKSSSKVTHLLWAPMAENDNSNILYTTMCLIGNSPSLASFRRMEAYSSDNFVSKEFNLGRNAAWTCAWNYLDQKFSVGSERKGLLIDFRTRGMWELNTGASDVLTQQFSKQNGAILLSGAKNGSVHLHDTRRSTKPSLTLIHKSAVCCLRFRDDENYLIGQDFSGKLKLWDVRKKKVVLEYTGQVNEYSRLSFHIDEEANILYGAGQDSYTRIWSLQDGQLLRTIPPPYPASRDTIPCLAYSKCWAGRYTGLLMGIRDELVFYSL